jgi:hypothetical protein
MHPASWMNDQSKYMVPNWPDQEKKKAANLYDNHQFIGVEWIAAITEIIIIMV